MEPSPRISTGIAAGLLVVAGVMALDISGPRGKRVKSSEAAVKVGKHDAPHSVAGHVPLSRKSEATARSTASAEAAVVGQGMNPDSSGRHAALELFRVHPHAPRMERSEDGFFDLASEWPAGEQSGDVWTPVSISAPGNSLSFSNRRLTVQASRLVPAAGGIALSVLMNEPEPDQPDGGHMEDQVSAEPVVAGPAMVVASVIPYRGFTREEELFRTKWGWTAFDQATRALQTDSD